MTSFVFRIRLRDPLSNEDADRVFESVKEEVAVEEGPRGHFIGFEREAPSFLDAVLGSLSEIINLGFEPVDVEDELVSMAGIAERTSRTRQSVSMLVSGQRGPGDFPHPVAGNVRSPLWHWADVASWFESTTGGGLRSKTGLGRSLPSTARSPTVCSLVSVQKISNGSTASLGRSSAPPALNVGGAGQPGAGAGAVGLVPPHGADLSIATSGISSGGPKQCSASQRTLSRHRNDHHAG